ncbi:MDR family MFS transporter [Lihuaxuella thermophila]|uniref:Predicted arabinose efflux permease, MFS family n=1 Tax=Lihuaxuella thermophila TaxID=1173111 RepID=A0A1H8AAR8_9BACL|nr:MFS transporter [Lihuaxuella thermophila]SEM67576.1 Predicted arabinose efflux permease, MFS family [Lihuaxuella thermophila]
MPLSRKERHRRERLHPLVVFLLFGTAVTKAATSMSLPFLAFYLTKQIHLNALQVSMVLGMIGLGGAAGGIIGGYLSDLLGRRAVLHFSLIAWAGIFFGFLFARDYFSFVALSLLNGLCQAFFTATSQALMADLTNPSKRLKVFSYRYTAVNIGMVTGPLLGAYLFYWIGILSFLFTGIVLAVYTYLLIRKLAKYRREIKQTGAAAQVNLPDCFRVIGRDRALGYYILGCLLFYAIYSHLETTLPIFLSKELSNGSTLFSLLLTVNALIVILFQSMVSNWLENKNPLSGIILGCMIFSLGYVTFAMGESPAIFVTGIIFVTLGEMVIFPLTNQMIDQLTDQRFRGTYYGAVNLAQAGLFLGPLFGGWMLKHVGASELWWITAFIGLHIIWFYSLGYRKYTKNHGVAIVEIVYRVLLDLRLTTLIKFVFKITPLVSILAILTFLAFRYYDVKVSFIPYWMHLASL